MMTTTVPDTIRILVAEDNEDHLYFITRALEGLDGVQVEVDSVRNGADALDFVYRRGEFVGRQRPHMILLDLKMPRVPGLEVLSQLKSDPELRSIPITVLSSSDRPEDIDASYRNGTNTYVVKRTGLSEMKAGLQAVSDYWTDVARLPEPPL